MTILLEKELRTLIKRPGTKNLCRSGGLISARSVIVIGLGEMLYFGNVLQKAYAYTVDEKVFYILESDFTEPWTAVGRELRNVERVP